MPSKVAGIWVAIVLALAAAMYALTASPAIDHSSALNAAFDARWMIAGTRLLAVAATAYLLASIVVRVHRGQWVRSAGTVEADQDSTQNVVDDQEDLQEQLRAAQDVIQDLEGQLAQADTTIAALRDRLSDPHDETGRGDADGTNEAGDRPTAP